MPFTFRLDPETDAKIRRLAKALGRSKSWVVREAMAQYDGGPSSPDATAVTAFDRLRSFVGVVRTGGADYSVDTHAKFRAKLTPQRRGRRSR